MTFKASDDFSRLILLYQLHCHYRKPLSLSFINLNIRDSSVHSGDFFSRITHPKTIVTPAEIKSSYLEPFMEWSWTESSASTISENISWYTYIVQKPFMAPLFFSCSWVIWLKLFFKIFFIYKYIKIILFLKLAYENKIKTSKK